MPINAVEVPKRTLGASDIKVSRLCLGSMNFGASADPKTSVELMASARDRGINFLDTADVYGKGVSEEVIGSALSLERDKWILATKVGNRMGADPSKRGLGMSWIARAVEDSLRRMQTDYIDVYYLHKEDETTPLLETLVAFNKLVDEGKIRGYGVSNFAAWRIVEILRLCGENNLKKPIVCQPLYNAVNRTAEVELLPACEYHRLGIATYSPLARGVLSGKYKNTSAAPKSSRKASGNKRFLETEWRAESIAISQDILERSIALGISASQFSMSWVLNNKLVDSVIIGPKNRAQFDDYVSSLDYSFTESDEDFIDARVSKGHCSTVNFLDPAYPVMGRIV